MHFLGQVYAATWFQTKVAVKYLTKEGGEAEKEFLNEIKVMAVRLNSLSTVSYCRIAQVVLCNSKSSSRWFPFCSLPCAWALHADMHEALRRSCRSASTRTLSPSTPPAWSRIGCADWLFLACMLPSPHQMSFAMSLQAHQLTGTCLPDKLCVIEGLYQCSLPPKSVLATSTWRNHGAECRLS